jgi:hypothetical protein
VADKSNFPSKSQLSESVHEAVVSALDRLITGQPQAQDLARRSTVRITVQSVSIEAGISRTTIYKSPQLLERIRSASERRNKVKTKKKIRDSEALRRALDEQRERNINLLSENATLLHRLNLANVSPLKKP